MNSPQHNFSNAAQPILEPIGLWLNIAGGHLGLVKQMLREHPEWLHLPVRSWDGAKRGDLPIMMAAAGGSTEMIDYLLSLGATLADRNAETGETPLHRATQTGLVDISRHLIGRGAARDARDKDGRTALHLLARLGIYSALATFLVQEGLDINARDNAKDTPLTLALYGGDTESAENFLLLGADDTIPGRDGRIPAQIVQDRIRELRDAGAYSGEWDKVAHILAAREDERHRQATAAFSGMLAGGVGKEIATPPKASFQRKRGPHGP